MRAQRGGAGRSKVMPDVEPVQLGRLREPFLRNGQRVQKGVRQTDDEVESGNFVARQATRANVTREGAGPSAAIDGYSIPMFRAGGPERAGNSAISGRGCERFELTSLLRRGRTIP